MKPAFLLGACVLLVIVIVEPTKSYEEIHSVAPPSPTEPEMDNHIHVVLMPNSNVENHNLSSETNETENNEMKSNENNWYNMYYMTTPRPYDDDDETTEINNNESTNENRENNDTTEKDSNESIPDTFLDNYLTTTEPNSDESNDGYNESYNEDSDYDSNDYWVKPTNRTYDFGSNENNDYWVKPTNRTYDFGSRSSEEITNTQEQEPEPEPEPEPKSKKDCRRIKFQTKDPEIDILIAVDTNLEDCVEEVDDKHTDLLLSESNSKSLKSKRSKKAEIIVYIDADYQGPSDIVHLKEGHCHKFKNGLNGFNNEISSINTKGSCINIYDYDDCNGRFAELGPAVSYTNSNLGRVFLNDAISSVKLC